MSESIKNGLMVFIAALLVVNTVLLVKNNSSSAYMDPASARASFERTANMSPTAVANKKPADLASVDPLKSASSKPKGPLTNIEFAENSVDFGSILQDSENTKVFTFTNTGSEPLIIENAKGACGCTVPQYPREPIAPGETGEIKVVYKPGKQLNKQNKTVTITANTEPANTILTVMADVKEVPA